MADIIKISDISLDKSPQCRVDIDYRVVDDYEIAMRGGDVFPPISIIRDSEYNYVVDGWHRVLACKRAGIDSISAEIEQGTYRDALFKSLAANYTNGQTRTIEDKKNAVMTMLKDPEWSEWSNSKIADACRVSLRFVWGLRDEFKKSYMRTVHKCNEESEKKPPVIVRRDEEKTPETRTFVHPKTGKTTTMNVSNIGKKSNKSISCETQINLEEKEALKAEIDQVLMKYSQSKSPEVIAIVTIINEVFDD